MIERNNSKKIFEQAFQAITSQNKNKWYGGLRKRDKEENQEEIEVGVE